MKKEDFEQFLNKTNFFISLDNGLSFTVKHIVRLTEDSIHFRDKFNSLHIRSYSEILGLSEERRRRND